MLTHKIRRAKRRGAVIALALLAVCGSSALSLTSSDASAATTHNPITGDGSSWAANAVLQWIADTTPSGLKVVFTSTGSAQGRKDFAGNQVDFALSDIPYGADPSDTTDTPNGRDFSYVPIVAGGTAFPYNLTVAGQQVRNLRLSGMTIAKIFTNQITNWDDPEITADMNGHPFPSIPIVPVVRSDGSGATAQFTRYLDTEYPQIWRPYQGSAGLTEYFPRKDPQVAQNGSDGVMNFVTSSAGAGSIGFDEYSYALQKNYPVVKLENAAGYFTLPTQYNDAVALTQAQINTSNPNDPTTYLTQNLNNVYSYNDPRTYPLSSYSYMIIPTGGPNAADGHNDSSMDTGKRQTLADYMNYSLCLGQSDAGKLGYSPLPLNLVQAAFTQIDKLGAADSNVDISQVNPANCNNPTFDGKNPNNNVLAQIAPQPPACDKAGADPCGDVDQVAANSLSPAVVAAAKAGKSVTGKTTTAGTKGSVSSAKSGTAAGTGGQAATSAAGGNAAATGVDPVTGAAVTSSGNSGAGGSATTDTVTGTATGSTAESSDPSAVSGDSADGTGTAPATYADPTVLAASPSTAPTDVLAPLAVVLLLAVLVVPVFVSRRLARDVGSSQGSGS